MMTGSSVTSRQQNQASPMSQNYPMTGCGQLSLRLLISMSDSHLKVPSLPMKVSGFYAAKTLNLVLCVGLMSNTVLKRK